MAHTFDDVTVTFDDMTVTFGDALGQSIAAGATLTVARSQMIRKVVPSALTFTALVDARGAMTGWGDAEWGSLWGGGAYLYSPVDITYITCTYTPVGERASYAQSIVPIGSYKQLAITGSYGR